VCAGLCAHADADAPLVAARELLRQLALACLTGNGDAHAKNLAMVYADEWRISPAFDLPSSYLYGDTTVAPTVAGCGGADVPRRAFVEFGATLGLPDRGVAGILDELCDRADPWLPDLDALPFPAATLRKLRRTVEFRRRLLHGLAA
jgi:serine/threonine-protein kinase HipA